MTRVRRWLGITGKLLRDSTAAISVEMALVATVFVFSLFPAMNVALEIGNAQRLESALYAGARHALRNPEDSTGMQLAVMRATDLRPMTVTTRTICECSQSQVSCQSTCQAGLLEFTEIRAVYSGSETLGQDDPDRISRQIMVQRN